MSFENPNKFEGYEFVGGNASEAANSAESMNAAERQEAEAAVFDELNRPGENGGERREKKGLKKLTGKAVAVILVGALALGTIGAGIGYMIGRDGNKAETKIENNQEVAQYELYENEYGIGYNYDGLFADESGIGYNENKSGKYNFAPGTAMGEAWGDEELAKEEVKVLAERQVDLNFAGYVNSLNAKDREMLGVGENDGVLKLGTDLETQKDLHDEALTQFDKIVDTAKGEFTHAEPGYYDNVYGKIGDGDEKVQVTTETVEAVRCVTYEDENTAIFKLQTENGSEILIKMGHFNEKGEFIADGCTQPIEKVTKAGREQKYEGMETIDDPDEPVEKQKPDDGGSTGGETPTTPTKPVEKTGKGENPHAGDPAEHEQTIVSEETVVTQEELADLSGEYYGYVDDEKAQPGDSSENEPQHFVADGATDGERLKGGEVQGGSEINGGNAVEEAVNRVGEAEDRAADQRQEEARRSGGENGGGAEIGQSNYSEQGEEEAFRNGDF